MLLNVSFCSFSHFQSLWFLLIHSDHQEMLKPTCSFTKCQVSIINIPWLEIALFFYISATIKVAVDTKSAKQKMLKKHLTITFSRRWEFFFFSSRLMDGPSSSRRIHPKWDLRSVKSSMSWPCQQSPLEDVSKPNAFTKQALLLLAL